MGELTERFIEETETSQPMTAELLLGVDESSCEVLLFESLLPLCLQTVFRAASKLHEEGEWLFALLS